MLELWVLGAKHHMVHNRRRKTRRGRREIMNFLLLEHKLALGSL
jgi:hypothetical protein